MYWECRTCSKTFSTLQGVTMHGEAKGHSISRYPVAIVECPPCRRRFKNSEALVQHLRHSSAHQVLVVRSHSSVGNTFCHICDKQFKMPDDLMRHNASPVHRPRKISCFVCPSKFKTPSGLAQHIEGSCDRLPLNRHQITAAVQALPINPPISLRPAIDGFAMAPRALITHHPTQNSFNGEAYQCHICDKAFWSLSSLEAHLNSPVHDDDEFKCPRCETQFSLISGLVQHLESSACRLSGIEDVFRRFENMTAQFSRALML